MKPLIGGNSASPQSPSNHDNDNDTSSSRSNYQIVMGRCRTYYQQLVQFCQREWKTLWKLLFALVAMADAVGCWPVFQEGWRSGVLQSKEQTQSKENSLFYTMAVEANDDVDEICETHFFYYQCVGQVLFVLDYMGPLFCVLCLVEAGLRAQQAREEMLELQALDVFEKKLARLYGSTRKINTNVLTNDNDDYDEDASYEEAEQRARKALRFWTPVLSTLFLWSLILPWRTFLERDCGSEADSAIATLWISQSLQQISHTFQKLMDNLTKWAFDLLLPLSFLWQPHRIIQRIKTLLRWVRYFRFAGPLLRLLLKLNDQFWVFLKTQKQAWRVQTEKAKRVIHRSMLFEDIQKLESLTNRLPGLSRIPTKHIFKLTGSHDTAVGQAVGNKLQEKKEQEKRLKRELRSLKERIRRSSKVFPSSDLYDRIVDLSQELTTTVGSTLWTANLISPQTRFSVSWRIIVTFALLSELSRICTSYQLYGRVDVSYATMMMSVLGCAQERSGNILTATGRLTRKIVRQIIRLPKEQLLSTCTKSSISSHTMASLLLFMSDAFETTIDLVCFIDIYVWFFTGELDPEGRVVPKPFFYRCILPGTLVQVLDHPTVPDALPKLMFYCLSAASAVGYSRFIRWMVAIGPAINVIFADAIKRFLFKPMEPEEWLRYTESLAFIPAISGADIRYATNMSHPNFRESFMDFSLRDEVGLLLSPAPKRASVSAKKASFLPPPPSMMERVTSSTGGLGLNIDASSSRRVTMQETPSSFLPTPTSSGSMARQQSSSTGLSGMNVLSSRRQSFPPNRNALAPMQSISSQAESSSDGSSFVPLQSILSHGEESTDDFKSDSFHVPMDDSSFGFHDISEEPTLSNATSSSPGGVAALHIRKRHVRYED